MERMGKCFFLILLIWQNLGGANAASDDVQNCQKKMGVSQGEKRWKAVRCSNRCTLVNGSARCTERKDMRRYKGTFEIFFGDRAQDAKKRDGGAVQQRGQGWRFAADAARITDERAGSEDRIHMSGGCTLFFVVVDGNFGAVFGKEEGAVTSIPGNEGRIAQACVNAPGSLRVFAVHWTPRNEALMAVVVKRVRATKHPWLVACDVHIDRDDLKNSLWYKSGHMFIDPPGEGTSACRSEGPNGKLIERTYDYVILSRSLHGSSRRF